MNKIININLAGRLIPIDEAAYDQLRDYLNRLKLFFSREEGGDEILRDMEDRIGELFQDKLKKGAPCISAEDIREMIGIMGSPEQIENEAGEESPAKGKEQQQKSREQAQTAASTGSKHLSRSKKEKMIGGVCGGLSNYFNIDPTIIRIALALITLAWGAGLVVYLLLWAILPVAEEEPNTLRRRLYRNPKQKVVGGVCSGIAAYANIDPIIPRVIFAAPLLGIVFFGILDNGIFFFPVLVGGLPTLVLLYIVLWASLPEATTVAEKLEMRGEKVDVQSLSQAIKSNDETTVPVKRSGLRSIFSLLIKIFVFFILGIILIVLASVIVAVIATFCGLAVSSVFVFPLTGLITESESQKWILWICVVLTLIIPFIAVIRLLVRIVTGRKRKPAKWLSLTLSALFGIGIFGLFWVASSIGSDFKTSYHKTYPLALTQPNNDTLVIRQMIMDDGGEVDMDEHEWNHDNDGFRFRDDSTIAINNLSLRITNSPDSLYHLQVQKSANGKNSRRAQAFATALEFMYKQEGNVLYLPKDFTLPKGQPFRGQKLRVELQVPVGKVFKTEDLVSNYYTDRSFVSRRGSFHYETHNYPSWDDDSYYKMGKDGPIEKDEEKEEDTDKQDAAR
jgi:phage shock protein PspC (stress-responsive transcriptional regulator)